MENSKIFVLDTSRGFSRFMKINYAKQFKIDVCNDSTKFKDSFNGEYFAAFIHFNKSADIVLFAYILTKVKHIFIYSSSKDLNNILELFKDVTILDFQLFRPELIKTINKSLMEISSREIV